MELIWKWIKPKVHGFSPCRGLLDMVKKFRKIIWHYNAGWLANPIGLRLNTYIDLL